jgi:NTE family protein
MGDLPSVPVVSYDPILVLSGGGSLGAAQVGALRPFYRAGFRPAAIVGTSVGAINGAFLAENDEPEFDRLRDAWLSIGAREIFSLNPFRVVRNFLRLRSCLFDSRRLQGLLQTHLPDDDFAALRVPFYATATNLTQGVKAVFHEGHLYQAILASAAIPGLFCPVEIDGQLYVDGGVVAGLDLETAVQLGARNILAVDLSICRSDVVSTDPYHVWRRSSDLTFREQVRREISRFSGLANIAHICPIRRSGLSPQDFSCTAELIADGEAIGEELVPRMLDADGHLRGPRSPGIAA